MCKRRLLWLVLLGSLGLGTGHLEARQVPEAIVPLYGLWETRFTLAGDYTNPYDPRQVSVEGFFTAPDGQTQTLPAFFMQPYTFTDTGQPLPAGEAGWFLRWTGTQVGLWRYEIRASVNGGAPQVLREGRLEVTASDERGFIRVGENGRYFRFQNGEAFFPLGQNLNTSWEGYGGLSTYLDWLETLAEQGANTARLFIDTPWFIHLEWVGAAGDYSASQAAAAQLDAILAAAQARGIYLQVVLIWHQAFTQTVTPPVNLPAQPIRPPTDADFDSHPYNSQNGGVLRRAESLFTNPAARVLLERRLRYIVGRWGYSPTIFAWELVNQVDRLPAYDAEAHFPFIENLALYLRAIDPYRHLITAGSAQPSPEIFASPAFDFATLRLVQSRPIEPAQDSASLLLNRVYAWLETTNKPILLTEFSLNPWFEPVADDPTGVDVHQTLWASALSGLGGAGWSLWWDTYLAPQGLGRQTFALARFLQGVAWEALALRPMVAGLVATKTQPYGTLRLDNFNRAFRGVSPPDTLYIIGPDASLPPTSQLSGFLYGRGLNAVASRPQTLIFTPPVDTLLKIAVRNVSPTANALLVVSVDSQVQTTLELAAGSQGSIVSLPLAAGRRVVVLDNLGDDWLELDFIEIADYVPPLRVVALADSRLGVALLWLHNRAYTWESVAQGVTPAPLRYQVFLPDFPTGTYRVEYWDTQTGQILGVDKVRLEGDTRGDLMLNPLPFSRDLALRVNRLEGDPLPPSATLFPTRTSEIRPSDTPTFTPTPSPTFTLTPSPSPTPTLPASATPRPTASPSPTPPPTADATQSFIPRATRTPRP